MKKVNEAPDKIYLFKNPITETPDDRWLTKRSDVNDIEYTRTDAFIEKACDFLRDNIDKELVIYKDYVWKKRDEFIRSFKSYMEGE